MNDALTINKIADSAGIAHLTARKRLIAGGAVANSDGTYSLPEVLRAWEKLASGRVGELNSTEAKTRLANLKIEEQTIVLRKLRGELIEMEPWLQYMKTLSKCLWASIQSLNLSNDDVEALGNELNRVTAEFVRQNVGPQLLTLQEAAEMEAAEMKEKA